MSDPIPEFKGRVVRSPRLDMARASGVTGRHEVWFPNTKDDAAAAVHLCQKYRTVFRSDMQAESVTDEVIAPEAS